MSIINKLKKINSNKAPQLFERHPLADEDLELRLQYLAAIALVTAIDRDITEPERQAFLTLANRLSVDAPDADEQLNERASVVEEDIYALFEGIRRNGDAWIYLLDLAWLHAADGSVDEAEVNAVEELAEFLQMDKKKVTELHDFALALKKRALNKLVAVIPKLPTDEKFQKLLTALLAPCFPYAGVYGHRFVDHGNGTLTDSRSGITWTKFFLGQTWNGQKTIGDALVVTTSEYVARIREENLSEFRDTLRSKNESDPICGFSDWAFPSNKALLQMVTIEEDFMKDFEYDQSCNKTGIWWNINCTQKNLYFIGLEKGGSPGLIVTDDRRVNGIGFSHFSGGIFGGGSPYTLRAILCRKLDGGAA